MKKHIHKIKSHILAHKITSFLILVAILGGGYWGYKKITDTTGETRYLTAKVKKGAIASKPKSRETLFIWRRKMDKKSGVVD